MLRLAVIAWLYTIATTKAHSPPQISRRDLGVPLRILPLGDSITQGWDSSDGNGYRLDLRRLLVASGNTVDFIGSSSNGANNTDNQYEGYPGKTISQIHQYIRNDDILAQQPNVVLLHAGTNDLKQYPVVDSISGAPDRLGHLMDEVLCRCPDTVLLVAQIVQDDYSPSQNAKFNAAVPAQVLQRRSLGYRILAVNFSSIGGSDLQDGIHPNDSGYAKMAQIWYAAMQNLPIGWLVAPGLVNSTTPKVETCWSAVSNGTTTPTSEDASTSSIPASTTTAGATASKIGSAVRRMADLGLVAVMLTICWAFVSA